MQTSIASNTIDVTINHFGAELCSIKDKNETEFIWQAGVEWKRHAPILFPIVGKLKNDSFSYNAVNFQLSQHGFARDCIFNLIFSNEFSCTFELVSSPQTKNNYPFDFVFQVNYLLIENKLTITYSVTNTSQNQMYFSVGAHPAFSCELNGNDTLNDYYLKFEKSNFLLSELNNGIRTIDKSKLTIYKNKLLLSPDWFDNDALVFENSQINKVTLCSLIGNQKITLECKDWPYFGIWTKKNCDKFICLEPWHGIADSEMTDGTLETKNGIISLDSQGNFSCNYSITLNS